MGYEKIKRPANFEDRSRLRGASVSTAASTALTPGAYALQTTSTGAPVVYSLATPKKGDRWFLQAHMVASSSVAPFHVNAPTSGAFGYAAATTAQDMMALSTVGAGVEVIALSATELLVIGPGSLSTST